MAEKPRGQNFLQGAAILALTVAIVKVIGAIYKIPLGNILGDEGSTHFGVAYNIYGVLLTFSTAGLPVALSRMVSASNALGKRNQTRRIFGVARGAFCVLGLVGTLAMLLLPQQLANLMDDSEAALAIRVLSPSVLLVCVMSAYRGYTQGLSDMRATSISQIIEVLCKLIFGLGLAWLMVKQGRGLPRGAAGAIAGVTIGSLLAMLYVIYYKFKSERGDEPTPSPDVPESRGRILLSLIKIGVPVTIGSAVLNIVALIDTKLILSRLQDAAGFSFLEAKVLYGVYFKVQTLFNLPQAFVVPLTISIIPAIAACIAKRNTREAGRITEASMRITSLLAMPCALGLSVLSYPIVNVVYPGSSAAGPGLLLLLGIASFFVCLMTITNSVLQAYGYERLPLYTMPIGAIIKIALNWVLIGNPNIGVFGAAWSTIACYGVISVINIFFILRKLPEPPKMGRIFVRPLIASGVMAAAAWCVYTLLHAVLKGSLGAWMGVAIPLVAAIFIAVVIYLILMIVLRAITRADMELIPRGGKLADKLHLK